MSCGSSDNQMTLPMSMWDLTGTISCSWYYCNMQIKSMLMFFLLSLSPPSPPYFQKMCSHTSARFTCMKNRLLTVNFQTFQDAPRVLLSNHNSASCFLPQDNLAGLGFSKSLLMNWDSGNPSFIPCLLLPLHSTSFSQLKTRTKTTNF